MLDDIISKRATLTDVINEWAADTVARKYKPSFSNMMDYPPRLWRSRHCAIIAPPGLGKTEAAIKGIQQLADAGKRTLYLVPSHRLSAELVDRMSVVGISAAVFRGLKADDPTTPGLKMCQNIEVAQAALAAGYSLKAGACGDVGRANSKCCRLRNACSYWRQMDHLGSAGVVIASHEFIFRPMPDAAGPFDAVIIDEAFWQAGLETNKRLPVGNFSPVSVTALPVLDDGGTPNTADTARLHTISTSLHAALSGIPPGQFLSRRALAVAGLTAAECRDAAKMEGQRRPASLIHPGMAKRAMEQAASRFGIAKTERRQALWQMAADLIDNPELDAITGRVRIVMRDGAHAVELFRLRPLHPKVSSSAILHLDATAEPDILKFWLEDCDVWRIAPESPGLKTGRFLGAFGNSRLQDSSFLPQIADFLKESPAPAEKLVITYKSTETILRKMLGADAADSRIKTTHFGALRGRDEWRDIRSHIIIGRPLPSCQDMHRMMLALTGQPSEEPRLIWRHQEISVAGTIRNDISAQRFADPTAEMVRRAITDAEIKQAVGRLRPFNLPPGEEACVIIFGDGALDIPCEFIRLMQKTPDGFEQMEVERVFFENAAHAAKAGYWPSAEAARQAYKRQREKEVRDTPLKRYFRDVSRTSNGWTRIKYQMAGAGQRPAGIWIASVSGIPDTRRWLAEKFGGREEVRLVI